MADNFSSTLARLQAEGKLAHQLTARQLTAIARSLQGYAENMGMSITADQVQRLRDAIAQAVQSVSNPVPVDGVTSGLNPATARNTIAAALKQFSAEGLLASNNIDFAVQVGQQVVHGGSTYVRDAAPDVVEEYPAWELLRVYDRDTPRGFTRGPKETLVPAPGQDWPSRWAAAGGVLTDGRMIALKSSAVWQNLGDGAGGYTDTLGNPFPPFAFNSGYDTENISAKEATALGIISARSKITAPVIDFSKLFSMVNRN